MAAGDARKARVRAMTAEAVREGLIDHTKPCMVCGAEQGPTPNGLKAVVLHHPDYHRPFLCQSLCRSCHGKVHAGVIPEPVTGRIYVRTLPSPEAVEAYRERTRRQPATRAAS